MWAIHDASLSPETVEDWTERLASSGVEGLQIRHRSHPDRALWNACTAARSRFAGVLFVNGRAEVACAAELDGVHLPEAGAPASVVRHWLGPDAQFGRSVHDAGAASRARDEGAAYVFYGPLFPSRSKPGHPRPGPAELAELTEIAATGLPVYAIGGVRLEHFESLARAGATGVAAIEMFETTDPQRLAEIRTRARELFTGTAR